MQTIKKQQVNSLLPKAKHPFRSSHEAPFHHASQFCFRSLFTRLLTTKIIRLQTKYLERPIGQRRGSRTFLGSRRPIVLRCVPGPVNPFVLGAFVQLFRELLQDLFFYLSVPFSTDGFRRVQRSGDNFSNATLFIFL